MTFEGFIGTGHWYTELRRLARREYFQRFYLITMSLCNNYFLFFDRFFEKYGLWMLQDHTVTQMYKDLQQYLQRNHRQDKELKSLNIKEGVKFLLEKISDYDGSYYKNNKKKCDDTKSVMLAKFGKKINLETEDHTDV